MGNRKILIIGKILVYFRSSLLIEFDVNYSKNVTNVKDWRSKISSSQSTSFRCNTCASLRT